MKAYDITKLTAELKNDNVQYRNKNILHGWLFWWASPPEPKPHTKN